MKITGAIFDFDGTLFDSMQIWRGIKERYFDYHGLVLTAQDEEVFAGLRLQEVLALANERFGMGMTSQELFADFFGFIEQCYMAEATPKNDIVAFLEKLQARGVKMGIATATSEGALRPLLEKYGMLGYFSEILSVYTVGSAKTEPKVYDAVLDSLGTEKETTWVFEDALYAAKTAKEGGYNLVGIYDPTESDADGLKAISDVYIHNYSEIDLDS
ncbi:MAG: HAD family phosphatase [Clostridia bacterium]|nr:HAD family phosphatase [Clostridia bacterium]